MVDCINFKIGVFGSWYSQGSTPTLHAPIMSTKAALWPLGPGTKRPLLRPLAPPEEHRSSCEEAASSCPSTSASCSALSPYLKSVDVCYRSNLTQCANTRIDACSYVIIRRVSRRGDSIRATITHTPLSHK